MGSRDEGVIKYLGIRRLELRLSYSMHPADLVAVGARKIKGLLGWPGFLGLLPYDLYNVRPQSALIAFQYFNLVYFMLGRRRRRLLRLRELQRIGTDCSPRRRSIENNRIYIFSYMDLHRVWSKLVPESIVREVYPLIYFQ